MSNRPNRPLHPVTAWCKECDWRWDRNDPNPMFTDARNKAAEEHARATGHAIGVSMPGGVGYEVIERRLTWIEEGPNYWITAERAQNGEPAFQVSKTMHGWLLTPAGDGRRFDAFASPEAAKIFAENFEERPRHQR